jgi:hypothetical protein
MSVNKGYRSLVGTCMARTVEGLLCSNSQGSSRSSQLGEHRHEANSQRTKEIECLRPPSGLGYSCARARTTRETIAGR